MINKLTKTYTKINVCEIKNKLLKQRKNFKKNYAKQLKVTKETFVIVESLRSIITQNVMSLSEILQMTEHMDNNYSTNTLSSEKDSLNNIINTTITKKIKKIKENGLIKSIKNILQKVCKWPQTIKNKFVVIDITPSDNNNYANQQIEYIKQSLTYEMRIAVEAQNEIFEYDKNVNTTDLFALINLVKTKNIKILDSIEHIYNIASLIKQQIINQLVTHTITGERVNQCYGYNAGTWLPSTGSNTKNVPCININRIPNINFDKYCIKGDNNLFMEYKNPEQLRRVPTGIQNLFRFIGMSPSWWPLPYYLRSSWPLFIYYKTLSSMGQHCIARELYHICRNIVHLWKQLTKIYSKHRSFKQNNKMFLGITREQFMGKRIDIYREYYDDFVRHCLKGVSSVCYIKTFTNGPAYSLLCHLHSLTAKSPYTKEQIINDITSWTSDHNTDGIIKNINSEHYGRTMDSIIHKWVPSYAKKLTYQEFANDVVRWGTSGGAPPVKIMNEKVKSKWAWGIYHCFDKNGSFNFNRNISSILDKMVDNIATIALKEEPQKTREIVSTPMPSYIRQSYLLYRWGKPPLPSPVSSSSWITIFEMQDANWYGCIDGERFDHTIPAWVIIDIIDRLGNLDDETRKVADAEIKSLKDLYVVWSDNRWKWRGGLLSGWRITSLVGSLVSYCAATYILEQLNLSGSCSVGVMGDDVVLYSNSIKITSDVLAKLYSEFGLRANAQKTVSGRTGEFLRKIRSSSGSIGFPALGLRSVVYANPWINLSVGKQEQECTSNWLIFLSRLIPHSINNQCLVESVYSLMHVDLLTRYGDNEWTDWLLTPISAGGGGTMEVQGLKWSTITRREDTKDTGLTTMSNLCVMYGIGKNNKTKPIISRIKMIYNNPTIIKNTLTKYSINMKMDGVYFRDDVNILDTIVKISMGLINTTTICYYLKNPLPRAAKRLRRWELIKYLNANVDDKTSYTTILSTKESQAGFSRIISGITAAYLQTRGFGKINISAIKTILLTNYFSNSSMPYGTW